jgi:hypothetical protein
MYMATLGANSNIIIKSDIRRFHRTKTATRFQCPPSTSSSSTVAVFKVLSLSTTTKPTTRLHFLRQHHHSRGFVCQCQHHKGKHDSSLIPTNIPHVSNCWLLQLHFLCEKCKICS